MLTALMYLGAFVVGILALLGAATIATCDYGQHPRKKPPIVVYLKLTKGSESDAHRATVARAAARYYAAKLQAFGLPEHMEEVKAVRYLIEEAESEER